MHARYSLSLSKTYSISFALSVSPSGLLCSQERDTSFTPNHQGVSSSHSRIVASLLVGFASDLRSLSVPQTVRDVSYGAKDGIQVSPRLPNNNTQLAS